MYCVVNAKNDSYPHALRVVYGHTDQISDAPTLAFLGVFDGGTPGQFEPPLHLECLGTLPECNPRDPLSYKKYHE